MNIEYFFSSLQPKQGFQQNSSNPLCPSTIIFTKRYIDWFWWEHSHRLLLDVYEVVKIRFPSSVTKVVMEFEMIESRAKELDKLLTDVFRKEERYRWSCSDGRSLKIIHQEDPWRYVQGWKWDGPTTFDGQSFQHHPPGDTMTYVVKEVTWEP